MKNILTIFAILSFSTLVNSQTKTDKTYDFAVFAKKVTQGLAFGVEPYFPDTKAKEYISQKTNISFEELNKIVAKNIESVNADRTKNAQMKLNFVFVSADIKIIEESPIKKADIIVHSEYKGIKLDLTLTNCTQTDRTWVLGDHMIASGDGIEQTKINNDEKKAKFDNSALGKMKADNEEREKKEKEASTKKEETSKSEPLGYKGKPFAQNGTDASSRYIQHNLIGLPLKGYVVTKSGTKKEAVIAYQEPEKLLLGGFDLAICKEENGKKADILNPSSEPNFASWLKKDDLRAFYVGGQMFYQATPGKWYIIMSEGAINELVNLVKTTNNGVNSYQVVDLIQKLNQEPNGTASMMLNFKNSMASNVFENKEMAEKIKNKAEGYKWVNKEKIILEYNEWYQGQADLEPVKYISGGVVVPTIKKQVNEKTEVVPAKGEGTKEQSFQLPDQFKPMIGTWVFHWAIRDGKDVNAEYTVGQLEGKAKKMILKADGVLEYEPDVLKFNKIKSATWRVELNDAKDDYVFVIILDKTDGFAVTQRQNILSINGAVFSFGGAPLMSIEYERVR